MEDFFQLQFKDIISILIAIITLVMTILIPVRIMKYQHYTGLASIYMSYDFAHAFQSVIEFFYNDCGCDVEKIPEKYYERYDRELDELRKGNFEPADVLHYQRRYLNDFFLELELCRKSSRTLKKIISKNWTTSEAYVAKILMYMNKAVDDNPNTFMDISSVRHEPMPKVKGLSQYLRHFYESLKDEDRWMQL